MKYNQIYKNNNNVWGNQSNELLQKIYSRLKPAMNFLDLGCGQGRDSLFMLKSGFKVDAVDNSREGINKIKEFVQSHNLPVANINLFCSDIENFNITKYKYNIINAFNSLQFLPKEKSFKIIENIKNNIKNNGYVIISGFTINDPLYKKTNSDKRCFFMPKELKNLFSDFKIIEYKEKTYKDSGHPGSPEPHQHGIVQLIAKKNSPK